MHERKARLKAELRNARGLVNSFTPSPVVGWFGPRLLSAVYISIFVSSISSRPSEQFFYLRAKQW